MQEQEFLKNENKPFLPQQNQIKRTVLQSLIHEYHILIKGLNNQEYQDYCNVKGACGQTIPLILILPIGLAIGTFQLTLLFLKNIQEGIFDTIVLNYILMVIFNKCTIQQQKLYNNIQKDRQYQP